MKLITFKWVWHWEVKLCSLRCLCTETAATSYTIPCLPLYRVHLASVVTETAATSHTIPCLPLYRVHIAMCRCQVKLMLQRLLCCFSPLHCCIKQSQLLSIIVMVSLVLPTIPTLIGVDCQSSNGSIWLTNEHVGITDSFSKYIKTYKISSVTIV